MKEKSLEGKEGLKSEQETWDNRVMGKNLRAWSTEMSWAWAF